VEVVAELEVLDNRLKVLITLIILVAVLWGVMVD
jgi:hypothetical protein